MLSPFAPILVLIFFIIISKLENTVYGNFLIIQKAILFTLLYRCNKTLDCFQLLTNRYFILINNTAY